MTDSVRLEAGDTAPPFTLSNDQGEQVSLEDFVGSQVVVYFYPAAMTPGCTTQACDFSNSLEDFSAAGFKVIGISPDKPEKLAQFRDKEDLSITLLSDPDREVMKAYGAFGEKMNYGKKVEGVIRSTILVDAHGKVVEAQYNVKAKGHVDRLKKQLQIP